MEHLQYVIAILGLTGLCAGWVAIQYLARRMNTKNHFDDLNGSSCGSCNCGGSGECKNEEGVA